MYWVSFEIPCQLKPDIDDGQRLESFHTISLYYKI